MNVSDISSFWFHKTIESMPLALVVFLLVWQVGFQAARRRLKAASRRIRNIDVLLGITVSAVLTGSVRFLAIFVVGLEAVEDSQHQLGLSLFLIPASLSAFLTCSRMELRALPPVRPDSPKAANRVITLAAEMDTMSEPVVDADRPKPKLDDRKPGGTPKFATYEEWCDDLSAWHSDLAVRRAEAAISAKQPVFEQQKVRRFWWNGLNRNSAAASVLLLGAVLVAGMGLYPPWEVSRRQVVGSTQVYQSWEYHWIFTPPFPRYSNESMSLDVKLLGVQWMTVVLVAAGVVAALKIHSRDTKP